jgi:hypothetical protein
MFIVGFIKTIGDNGHVHLAYNPSYSAYFFSRNNIFLSQKNQPTVFFSRLIIPAERLQYITTGSE